MPDVSRDDLSTLAVYAVRYALPRASYCPDEVIGIVRRHLGQILDRDLPTMSRDIQREMEHSPFNRLGWETLLREVQAEQLRRGSNHR